MEQDLVQNSRTRRLNNRPKVVGWGADLEPSVRPGVPRDKKPYLGVESLYPAIVSQPKENTRQRHAASDGFFCKEETLFAYGFGDPLGTAAG